MYNPYVLDHINEKHDRMNEYILDVVNLETKIKEADAAEKKKLKAELANLKKNKKSHPYIVKLTKFEQEEKEFKQKLKSDVKSYKTKLGSIHKKLLNFEVELFVAKECKEFYSKYTELTYDALLESRIATVKIKQLPEIISRFKELEIELGEALEAQKNIDMVLENKKKVELEEYKAEQNLIYQEKVDALKQKRKDGLISKQAYENGVVEYKRNRDELVKVKKYELPSISSKERIRVTKIELNKGIAKLVKVMKANISEARFETPVEVSEVSKLFPFITFYLPGLGQLMNKQYVKALLFFIGSLYTYVVAVPYALGFANYQGDGISGLISLANEGMKLDRSIIFMIEGIIAIFLILIAIAVWVVNFSDIKKVAKDKRLGIRHKTWYETKQSILEDGFPYITMLPALLFTIFVVFVPVTTTILLSFTNMDPKHQAKFNWVGLANYKLLAAGEGVAGGAFWPIFGWTVVWTLGATTLAILIGFFLALLVNGERIKGKAFFRAIYLLPWAVPAFITIMFFSFMFGPEGALTNIINDIWQTADGSKILIKNDPFLSRITLMLMQGWLGSAYVFLLATGVLQAIPADLYEAAQIDGASSWQKTARITIPLVLFQTAPLLVGQYTFNFNNFSIIYLFNSGGPFNPTKYGNLAGSTDLLISYVYKLTMENQYQSIGAAVSIIISLGLMVFAFIGFKNSKAFKEETL